MRFRLYSGNTIWVLVPECIVPPRSATSRHGPLRFLGEIDGNRLGPSEHEAILAQIDENLFAQAPAEMASRLLAAVAQV